MASRRKTGIAIGALFLLAMATYMPGSGLVLAALNHADHFANIDITRLHTGVFLEFINSVAVVGIAVLLFPILQKKSAGAAAGYLAFRIMEAVLLIAGSACALLLAQMSQGVVIAQGEVALAFRDILFQMAMLSLGLGGIIMGWAFCRYRLIPRGMSILGIVGYASLFASGWFSLCGYASIAPLLYAPGAIFEIIFPLWLFAKGFAPASQVVSL